MKKFIYSINEIFNATNGCLFSYGVKGYYIAPYQRGFKWKSESVYDQVPVLLMDLYEAYKVFSVNGNSTQEYYLQYITVKTNEENNFEVIDGQQRLTTLTLLFNTLEHSGIIDCSENIVKSDQGYLVNYARYENTVNIFEQVLNQVNISEEEDNKIAEQDKYFMVKAVRCIKKFFSLFNESLDLLEFIKFIKNNVKIILNKEDDTTSAEEIFANLNSNKVPLTNAYLIKGLLLTKASRFADLGKSKRFKEVMDQRSIMGRTWDEITAWFSNPKVSLLFFGVETNGIEKFLEIISFASHKHSDQILADFKAYLSNDKNEFKNPYSLFNKYHEHIITAKDSYEILDQIKHTYWRLKSWYNDNELYNLIAFRQAKRKKNYSFANLVEMLGKKDRISLVVSLQDFVVSKLPENKDHYQTAGYKDYNKTMDLLLAINIFQMNIGSTEHLKFDFYSYQTEDWSLEHIFPQNPNIDDFDIKDDEQWILNKINAKLDEYLSEGKDQTEYDVLKKLKSDIETNKTVNSKELNFIFEQISDVDVLGNMALLSRGVNSSLSNGFFNTKRKILLNKINTGSFVPKHTIDVFSKMLELDLAKNPNVKFDDSLTTWSQTDIDANKYWIKENTEAIITHFNSQQIAQEPILETIEL